MPFEAKRVLIVANDDEEAKTLSSMLETEGCYPITTWSGIEALDLLKWREFDMVLVDSYLADLYVGEFLERFNRLSMQPCMILMKEGLCRSH
jgi:CheY-like chemotaxis protein